MKYPVLLSISACNWRRPSLYDLNKVKLIFGSNLCDNDIDEIYSKVVTLKDWKIILWHERMTKNFYFRITKGTTFICNQWLWNCLLYFTEGCGLRLLNSGESDECLRFSYSWDDPIQLHFLWNLTLVTSIKCCNLLSILILQKCLLIETGKAEAAISTFMIYHITFFYLL